jgi:GWxTD domain-containing protein
VITGFLSQFWIQRLGWTLLHFLWQGTAIVAVYMIIRRLLGPSLSAQGRYALACATLVAMEAAPPLTFLLILNAAPNPLTLGSASAASWRVSFSEWQRILPIVVTVWLAGVLALSIRVFAGWRFTIRLRATSHPAPAGWQLDLERIAAQMGGSFSRARWPIFLKVSSLVDVPTVIGWLRPIVLLPIDTFTSLPAGYTWALLAHEIAHIRRHDYLANILQSIAEAVLFYHPAVWWISAQIRAERELCCDDLAVAASGDPFTYAHALMELESQQQSRRALAVAANSGSLVNRIRRLLEPAHTTANNLPAPGAAWAMVLFWLAGIGTVAVHAREAPARRLPVVLNLAALPAPTARHIPPPHSPVIGLAKHARATLLYDPVLSAQVLQPRVLTNTGANDNRLQSPWSEWLNEDVTYIITDNERNAFLQLTTDDQRAQFVEQFWLRRDPTPGTVENEYKNEHYRRIEYANRHYGSSIPGWKDDRGRMYIVFGPADEIDITPATLPDGVPAETWTYHSLPGFGNNFRIVFVGSGNTGEYHIATDQPQRDVLTTAQASPQAADAAQTPALQFQDLESAMSSRPTGTVLPMWSRVDYLGATGSSSVANISLQFRNQDLYFQANSQFERSVVHLYGRVTTMTGRPVAAFEAPLEIAVPPDMLPQLTRQTSVYERSVALPPGVYRLNIAAKDVLSGNLNRYDMLLTVPRFDSGKLASSSMVLADRIERLPVNRIAGSAFFAFGDTIVRPRLGNEFTKQDRVGIYLQIYNFQPDQQTGMPSGSIVYEIEKAESKEKVMDFSEEVAAITNASPSQVTIEKLLPLGTFDPGSYVLTVTATDRNAHQTVQQQQRFAVISQ